MKNEVKDEAKAEVPAQVTAQVPAQVTAELEPLSETSVRALESSARRALEEQVPADEVEPAFREPAALDRLAERLGGDSLLGDPPRLHALAVVLGVQLARELALEWVEERGKGELGLRRPGSTVVFYPRRMVHSQSVAARAEGRAAPRLGWLVKSTREYLKALLRFSPTTHRQAET